MNHPARWYVRPETHAIRFGETRRDAIVWAVYLWYGTRQLDRSPILLNKPTLHATRSQAVRYARNQARLTYGGRR
ncbi:MAG: hypothetical protein K0S37_2997 [Microbacterium sp.]|jgi:hypothetical protein|nr:hypothetical protein [Microbacterium sp.]